MVRTTLRAKGFTLITSLMLLMLLSGLALGLLMMVNTEGRAGGSDVENSLAYRAAEGAIEKMTSDLATIYGAQQSPQPSDITALNALQPNLQGITFPPGGYTLTPRVNPVTNKLVADYGQISGGANEGLYAQLTPVELQVIAERPNGEQVRMLRTVEVAQIPVFQFGVFSDSDLAFFSSPELEFAGRVHTNGDLYLGVSNSANLWFHDKITAFGNVVRTTLPNGLAPSTSYNNNGTVYIPKASGGCDLPSRPACRPIGMSEGSVVGGPQSAQNNLWPGISKNTYNYEIIDGNYGNPGGTGAKELKLPFVGDGTDPKVQPFEIIRRPPVVGGATSPADSSRLGSLAQIRILLSDDPADLDLADGSHDATQRIQLRTNVGGGGWADNGVVINGRTYYFAMGNTDPSGGKGYETTAQFKPPAGATQWPLIDGWLLVEYKRPDGTWVAVTKEWLSLGFARGLAVPAAAQQNSVLPGASAANTDLKNAILYFQLQADRNGDGVITTAGDINTATDGNNSQYNWFPINLYDTREGEVRDWASGSAPGGASTCSVNGVMNAVELNVGNLRKWLKTKTGPGGVDADTQNGYVLYFSDRRGMQKDPFDNLMKGEYGFEDVINTSSNAGTPDGNLEPNVTIRGKQRSPEDVDGNGRLDKYGVVPVGAGFGVNTAGYDPFTTRIPNCYTVGRKNRVTGARHVLKLVDGSLGNVPTRPDPDDDGGFTVASENPVYIQGNYNSSAADPTWTNPTATEPKHAAAAVIADTVTLLSNNWQDAGYSTSPAGTGSLLHPTDATKYRPALTTYYRVAIAAGKTITFPHPTFGNSTTYFGTDGGLHNFLRFLENWNGKELYYKGSLVSLFYSTYNTGTFKCCNYAVYEPPVRRYFFDPLFQQPSGLPPGTPMFRDVNNLSYRQDFTPSAY